MYVYIYISILWKQPQCFPPKCHRFPPCCCAHATPAAHRRPKFWWWWWMSNQWCMKLPLLAVCIDVVESSFVILFKRFQLLFWDFDLPVASNSQGPETMLMLSCHVIVDTLSATSRGYNSCNLVLCLTTTAKDKGGIILVRTLQALWKSIKSYNSIIIMILISNTVYIKYEIHSNTIKCYNSTR